jgi:hypothetical protein
MKHGPGAKQRIIDVLGNFIWAVAIGAFAAFIIFNMFIKEPLPLDPVEAYCTGGADVWVYLAEYSNQPADWDQIFDTCKTSTRTGIKLFKDAHGPLYPTYDTD